ncbi:ATP-binding protein [Mycolicibacterium setense]|uniref:Anti-sigma regulatory factor n=1 Tax=Mycolicibacterium setense TaxID=431269 RepID=A0ABR4YM58_9MYCO|nr:ATP-binding protein [Mycolicibacterium setense]KHO18034.1 anti-sigma regulatory factor [Mycolicibacterium setense]KHO19817.1 anti-sigma regulatory factor [Mycolicibacterium setense]MCV7112096.1 ATP-binding protein [Mycolicibacterium setense]
MTDAGQSAHFTKHVRAAPEDAARIRREFSSWLGTHLTLDATTASDVVLAVNEALANAAEFAYLDAPAPGLMHLRADYDGDTDVLTVTVSDEGVWRIAETDHKNPARGRGIPLMRALTDRAVIDSNQAGTEVRLQWDHIDQNCGSRTT